MILAIDFDGTCVTHEYPKVGKEIGAAPVLKKLVENGHQIMLWTMRGTRPHHDGTDTLGDAIKWFEKHDIKLWGVNENPEQKASGWSNSHKQYAQMYIDDTALGCPLKIDKKKSPRPFVDWDVVEKYLTDIGLIKQNDLA